MKYVLEIFPAGISGYEKKTGYPIGYPAEKIEFEAQCHTEAAVFACKHFNEVRRMYEGTPHFNVSKG